MIQAILVSMIVMGASAWALPKEEEHEILMSVVHKYELNEDEARLLFAIRRHENGRPGLEFGIGQEEGPGHRARRYAHDPRKSLRLQAEWAAGTIKRRFDGNLWRFAQIWCPRGAAAWYRSVYNILMTEYAVAPQDLR